MSPQAYTQMCLLSLIPAGLSFKKQSEFSNLSYVAWVARRQGTLTNHFRQPNCRLLRPPVTNLICLVGGRTSEAPHDPPTARDHTVQASNWRRPVLLTCNSVCFWNHDSYGVVMKRSEAAETGELFVSYAWGQNASWNKSYIGNVSISRIFSFCVCRCKT